MSRMITARLDDALFARVDRERKRRKISRARAVQEALGLWLEERRLAEAIRLDQTGYERLPVSVDEFSPVLGAQRWPK